MAGGRLHFPTDQKVRILTLDGHISDEEYYVVTSRADRRGHVLLKEIKSGPERTIRVTQRRVLLNLNAGDAFVVANGDRFRAVCPKCEHVVEISPSDESITCPTHGEFPLHWRTGERPMTETITKKTKDKVSKPTAAKKDRPVREPVVVDLKQLANLDDCELWTKTNVRFDHARIDVQAHVLLYTGNHPRKLCFNTYNGTLGKKGEPLPADEFVSKSSKDKRWFAVKDLEQARAKLTKEGYEKA